MKLKYIVTSLLVFLSFHLIPTSANAQTCSELLHQIGRLYEPDSGKSPQLPLGHKAKLSDCNSNQLEHFQTDFTTVKTVKGVQDRNQILGTWVRDDVLAIYSGLFIPVYEILEITSGNNDQEVVITQKVIRAYDPADWFSNPAGGGDPIEIRSAGRNPTIGKLTARLTQRGYLAPVKIEYFDIPVESERGIDLAMKAQMMSLQHNLPFLVNAHNDRLAFFYPDRSFGKTDRIVTFRKRQKKTILSAMHISLVGQISMVHFHCFVHAIETGTNAYKQALGDTDPASFSNELTKLEELSDLQMALYQKGADPNISQAGKDEVKGQLNAIRIQFKQSVSSGALKILQTQTENGNPFGCKRPL